MSRRPSGSQHALLAGHFLDRLLTSELISREAEARVTLIQILAVLTIPGFVISALLINKYAALAAGQSSLASIAALNDKCRFLFFSMVVMGVATVVEWDALFPDRRDLLIISPLPVRTSTLFKAKVHSLLQFLLLFSLFVNLIPALLFPFIAGGGSLGFLVRFALSHVATVVAANAFMFLALIAVQGLLMNAFRESAFRKISRLVQLAVLILLLTAFFVMPLISFEELRRNPWMLAAFPPAWFLGLYEILLWGTTREFGVLAFRALGGLGLASLGFIVAYLVSYKRQVPRVLEAERAGLPGRSRWRELLQSAAQGLVLRTPAERAVFNFIYLTLFNNELHRLCFGAYLGVGVAFAAMGIITLLARHGYGAIWALRNELMSIPLVLTFFTLVGMRVAFGFPARLGANWIFRLTEQENKQPYLAGVHKAMLLIGVLPVIGVTFPLCIGAWGWCIAAAHTLFVLMMSLLLIEALLFRLDKIPFTCTYLPGTANLKLMMIPYVLAFTVYAYSMTTLERCLLQAPALFAAFTIVAVLALLISAWHRRRRLWMRRCFVYEVTPLPVAEPLTLCN